MKDLFRHHLPDVNTMGGVLNLLSLATVNFLGNVVDFRTYSAPNQGEDTVASDEQKQLLGMYDRSDITGDECFAMCYARGIAIVIFNWIRDHCTIVGRDGSVIDDLPSIYICKLLLALIRYKRSAMEQNMTGAPHCSSAALQKQIENVVQCDKRLSLFWKSWDKSYNPRRCSISFMTSGYTVKWSSDAFEGLRCEMLLSFLVALLNYHF